MTLTNWKEDSKKNWHDIARELSDILASLGSADKVYDGRLNRLRAGKTPTKNEIRALLILTKNKVDSFSN